MTRKTDCSKIPAHLITLIFFLFFALCLSVNAYAATAPTSNISGSISIVDETVDYCVQTWEFNFTINSGNVGDTVSITTNDLNIWAPRDVTIGSGEKIGVLEFLGASTDYPNSWNQRRNYQLRLTKEVASASVTLQGTTTESYNRSIYNGGHYETAWIAVNGTTAASKQFHMETCSWGQTDYYASIVSGLPGAIYDNGTINPWGSPTLTHDADHGAHLAVGDIVVWHFKQDHIKFKLADGRSIGEEIVANMGYNPGQVPSTVIRTEPYGFLEVNGWTPFKYKVVWCTDNEAAIQITQVGTGGIEWDSSPALWFYVTPMNGTTIDFANKRTRDCDYYAAIYRGDSQIYRYDGTYNTLIQSQEMLSEASFYARVNTSVTNGSITPSVQTDQGANITISYSPNEGYELEYIKVDGSDVSLSTYANSYTFYNTQGTHTVDVKYKIKTFTISTSVANGSITPTSVVNWSTNKTVSYSPNSGYLLNTVTVDGSPVNIASYPDSYTFSNIRANHSIAVSYASPSASKNWA